MATTCSSTATMIASGVSPASAAGPSRDDRGDLDARRLVELGGRPRGERAAAAGQAQVGPADPAVPDEGGEDGLRRGVERDGETEALADAGTDDRRVDADDPAPTVGQRTAGVARMERGVGLDHVVDDPGHLAVGGGQRASEGGHDPGADRAAEAERVADRDDQLADPEVVGVAELGRHEVVALAPAARRGP